MPVVLARDPEDPEQANVCVIVPRRVGQGGAAPDWEWDEVEVGCSQIQGFGLFTRQTETLDWSRPPCPKTR